MEALKFSQKTVSVILECSSGSHLFKTHDHTMPIAPTYDTHTFMHFHILSKKNPKVPHRKKHEKPPLNSWPCVSETYGSSTFRPCVRLENDSQAVFLVDLLLLCLYLKTLSGQDTRKLLFPCLYWSSLTCGWELHKHARGSFYAISELHRIRSWLFSGAFQNTLVIALHSFSFWNFVSLKNQEICFVFTKWKCLPRDQWQQQTCDFPQISKYMNLGQTILMFLKSTKFPLP